MYNSERLEFNQVCREFAPVDPRLTGEMEHARLEFPFQWIVLDDDPTGVQTVSHVSVYTDWSLESIREGFAEDRNIFYILTNSRGMTEAETVKIHQEIAEKVLQVSRETQKEFRIISRGDSTLRGHYPVETETLKETLEKNSGEHFDGEIICPFFLEGNRYTCGNVHYIKMDEVLVPVAETEFAEDATFGYQNSHLGRWIEEKTKGRYPADQQIYISIQELRTGNIGQICRHIMEAEDFKKVIVNALCYEDLYIFALALYQAEQSGKHFMLRTASALPMILGNIKRASLLDGEALVDPDNPNGGLIIVGSHVQKTTMQLEQLLTLREVVPIAFRSSFVLEREAFEQECARVQREIEAHIACGDTVAVYTERTVLLPDSDNPEDALMLSMKISDALWNFVYHLKVRPRFIIAKGGITSSEVGVKGLSVKRAEVAGQILPGIPVWKTGKESRFPGLSYIIFPGNVGEISSLKEAVKKLI